MCHNLSFKNFYMIRSECGFSHSLYYGYAVKSNRQTDFGSSFIAAFDRQSGKQKYCVIFPKDAPLTIDYKKTDSEIYLLSKNSMAKYDLENGYKISDSKFDVNKVKFMNFIDSNTYLLVKEPNSHQHYFYNLAQLSSSDLHINAAQGEIISLDADLNITNIIKIDKVGSKYLSYKDLKFILKDEKTYVINDDGRIIAELKVGINAYIVEDTLYDKYDKSFIIIDLKKIFP